MHLLAQGALPDGNVSIHERERSAVQYERRRTVRKQIRASAAAKQAGTFEPVGKHVSILSRFYACYMVGNLCIQS